MTLLPRLALATPPDGGEPAPASLAMLAGLTRVGWRVQHFRSRARPFGTASVDQITGLPGRHLDAWLMPPGDLSGGLRAAVVDRPRSPWSRALDDINQRPDPFPFDRPGWLGPIREALNLPTLAFGSLPSSRSGRSPAGRAAQGGRRPDRRAGTPRGFRDDPPPRPAPDQETSRRRRGGLARHPGRPWRARRPMSRWTRRSSTGSGRAF